MLDLLKASSHYIDVFVEIKGHLPAGVDNLRCLFLPKSDVWPYANFVLCGVDVIVEFRTDDKVVLGEPALKLSPVITAFSNLWRAKGGRIDPGSLHLRNLFVSFLALEKSPSLVTS